MSTNCIYCSEIFDSEEELNKHLSICKSIKELLDNMTLEMRQELEKNIIRDIDNNNKDVYKECHSHKYGSENAKNHVKKCLWCKFFKIKYRLQM